MLKERDKIFPSLLAIFGLIIFSDGWAQQVGRSVTITDPVAEDFYGAGRDIEVLSSVTGDVVVAGGNVLVSGTVTGDVIGAETDRYITQANRAAELTLVAWGSRGGLYNRSSAVTGLIDDPVCVGTTKHGQPRHPLYVPSATPFLSYPAGTI